MPLTQEQAMRGVKNASSTMVTATEARAEAANWNQQFSNGRLLPPTLARIQKMQRDEVFAICNVGPWPYILERQGLSIFIPAYDPEQDTEGLGYAKSEPMPDVRREAKIINESEFGYFEDDGRQVALDMIGIGFGLPRQQALDRYGVFVPAGKEPTKHEIAEARRRLDIYCNELIEEARVEFDKGRENWSKVRNDRHLWAARERGIDEAWVNLETTDTAVRCDSCGKRNPKGIAKCQCGNIINFELYKSIALRQKRQMEELEMELATRPEKN